MTKTDFEERYAEFRKRSGRLMWGTLPLCFGSTVGSIAWFIVYARTREPHLVAAATLFTVWLGSCSYFIIRVPRLLRAHDMLCPSCSGSLAQHKEHVVLTAECPSCGALVIDRSDAS